MVARLTDGIILYHGSYCEVKKPELSRCRKYKDFGKGFYLTTDRKQAESFAILSTQKAIANMLIGQDQDYGVISTFQFSETNTLISKTFSNADSEWLHCIVGHRKRHLFSDLTSDLAQYDIIGGKIANDDTNATIITYMSGAFGAIGSGQADQICISLLLPDRLKDQYCFRTENALRSLHWLESERIWMKK